MINKSSKIKKNKIVSYFKIKSFKGGREEIQDLRK